MSKFLTILFIGFFLFIGLPTAFLLNKPECLKLVKSQRFINMIEKLQGKVPIEKSAYKDMKIWNDNGAVDYSVLLTAIKRLMAEVKYQRKTSNQQIPHTMGEHVQRYKVSAAEHFLEVTHKEFIGILEKKCGKNWFGFSVNVEKVLDEVLLECDVDQKEVLEALQKIWVLKEPDTECHKLVKLEEFTKMIEILEKKIPIKEGDVFDAEGKIKYAKLLSAINRFILDKSKIDNHFHITDWAVKHGYVSITDKYKALYGSPDMVASNDFSDTYSAVQNEYVVTTDKYKALQPFKDILKVDYAVDGEGVEHHREIIVGNVLEEAVKCAKGVHEFTQNMTILKKGKDYNKAPNYNWTEANKKFEEELSMICELKTEDTDKMAEAGEVNADANVKH